ncbi:hypothetical protein GCM10020255_042460 [Rhodococcus baikonurensis]
MGVYPEATISRSFEIKEFKSGAARMAIEAGVPIVPVVIWGAQRVWTKGYPKRLGRTNTPISIAVGEPIAPFEPASELTAKLRSTMQGLLLDLQKSYDHPAASTGCLPASVAARRRSSRPTRWMPTRLRRKPKHARHGSPKADPCPSNPFTPPSR